MTRRDELMKFHKLADEFKKITGITVPYDLFGIDIVKLDKALGTADLDGISMEQYVTAKYGKRASEIIDEIIPLSFI